MTNVKIITLLGKRYIIHCVIKLAIRSPQNCNAVGREGQRRAERKREGSTIETEPARACFTHSLSNANESQMRVKRR